MPSPVGLRLVMSIVAVVGVVILIAFLNLAGSAVVVDETGEVASAVITNGSREQRLLDLPGGYFYAIPKVEGVIEVRCRNGARKEGYYVTGHMHTWVSVHGDVPCASVREIR